MSQEGQSIVQNPLTLMLSRFLESGAQRTAIVRGAWGVGKSYAINDFVETFNFNKCSGIVAKSSVSMFGKQSFNEIQREIFSSATQVGSDEEVRKKLGAAAHRLMQLEKYVSHSSLQRTLRWLSSKTGQIQVPWIGGLGAMFSQGNYGFVNQFLVILDDLERRSSIVGLRDVLGLIDDLAVHRECKVIAICNEDALEDNDRELLSDFKEKVFDLDLLFVRSPKEIARIGLPDSCQHKDVSEKILESLGISNIRVAKRYAFLVEQMWSDITNADPRIIKEILEHVAILTWARYDSTAGIPQDKIGYLASEASWMASAVRQEGEDKPAWEVNWDSATSALQFSSETYDSKLIEYLRTGIWAPGSMADTIAEKSQNLEQIEAAASLRAAWRLYADSLDPDQTAFVDALIFCIRKNSKLLSPRDVDSAFQVLEDLGIDVSELVNTYLQGANDQVQQAALEDWPFEDFRSKSLRPLVEAFRSSEKVLPTIDAALERIAMQRSWSEEDIQALDSCSENDLFGWMRSNPKDLSAKVKRGLLFLGSQASDDRYTAIGQKAVRALRRLATLSELNRIRVEKLFNIRLEPTA